MQPQGKSSSFTLCISRPSYCFQQNQISRGYFGKYRQIGLREDDCWFLPFTWSKEWRKCLRGRSRSRSRGLETEWCYGLQWQLCVCVRWFLMMKLHKSFPAFHGRTPNIFGKTRDLYPNKAPVSLLPSLANILFLRVDRPVLLMLLLNWKFCASWNFYACFSRHHTSVWWSNSNRVVGTIDRGKDKEDMKNPVSGSILSLSHLPSPSSSGHLSFIDTCYWLVVV